VKKSDLYKSKTGTIVPNAQIIVDKKAYNNSSMTATPLDAAAAAFMILNIFMKKCLQSCLLVERTLNDDYFIIFLLQANTDELNFFRGDNALIKGKYRRDTVCIVLLDANLEDGKIGMNNIVIKRLHARLGDIAVPKVLMKKCLRHRLVVDKTLNDDNLIIFLFCGDNMLIKGKKCNDTACIVLADENLEDGHISMNKVLFNNLRAGLGDTTSKKVVYVPSSPFLEAMSKQSLAVLYMMNAKGSLNIEKTRTRSRLSGDRW